MTSSKEIHHILNINNIKRISNSDSDYQKALHIYKKEIEASNNFEKGRINDVICNWIYGTGVYNGGY